MTEKYVIRIYLAGNIEKYDEALHTLELILRMKLSSGYSVEVIDVTKNPEAAIEGNVFVTPTIEVVAPSPGTRAVGRLADKSGITALVEALFSLPPKENKS